MASPRTHVKLVTLNRGNQVHTDEKWWPLKTPKPDTSCNTQIDLKASHSLQPTLHINSLHIKTCPRSCYGSWGFAAKGSISSSKSNTFQRLLFSAHKFFLAVSFVHRGGDLLLITSSTPSNWMNRSIFICLHFLLLSQATRRKWY